MILYTQQGREVELSEVIHFHDAQDGWDAASVTELSGKNGRTEQVFLAHRSTADAFAAIQFIGRVGTTRLYVEPGGDWVRGDAVKRLKGYGLEREANEADQVVVSEMRYTFRQQRIELKQALTGTPLTDVSNAEKQILNDEGLIPGPGGP